MAKDRAVSSDYICTKEKLATRSPKDKPWDTHRAQAQQLEEMFSGSVYGRYATRISRCSGVLRFADQIDEETGEVTLKLRQAEFCRVRHCPVCQWRRSLMWQARFYQALPALQERYPKHRFIFLTLTVRNCPIWELRKQLQEMNAAWKRMIETKVFGVVKGFIRATEVTRSKNNLAHPHFHCLLAVNPSYFKTGYISKNRWSLMWRDALRADYDPVIDVRAVRGEISGAVSETLKYSVKPEDLLDNEPWLFEYVKQVHRLRFISTGGILKDVLRQDSETDNDFIAVGDEEAEQALEDLKAFTWNRNKKYYLRDASKDISK